MEKVNKKAVTDTYDCRHLPTIAESNKINFVFFFKPQNDTQVLITITNTINGNENDIKH